MYEFSTRQELIDFLKTIQKSGVTVPDEAIEELESEDCWEWEHGNDKKK